VGTYSLSGFYRNVICNQKVFDIMINKEKWRRLITGFLVYSILYFIVGYFFKLPNMCYDNLNEWNCLSKSLGQTAFFGVFMMVFDYFVLKKFSGNKASRKNNQ